MWKAGALSFVAALAVAAGAQAAHRPTLTWAATQPTVAVHGSHFRARERVRLRLVYGMTLVRRVTRASSGGAFTTSFGTLSDFDPCTDSFSVVAVGASGDHATLKFIPRECPPSP